MNARSRTEKIVDALARSVPGDSVSPKEIVAVALETKVSVAEVAHVLDNLVVRNEWERCYQDLAGARISPQELAVKARDSGDLFYQSVRIVYRRRRGDGVTRLAA